MRTYSFSGAISIRSECEATTTQTANATYEDGTMIHKNFIVTPNALSIQLQQSIDFSFKDNNET